MHLLFHELGMPRFPGFTAISILAILLMAVLVAAMFIALRPLESNPLPRWDGARICDQAKFRLNFGASTP